MFFFLLLGSCWRIQLYYCCTYTIVIWYVKRTYKIGKTVREGDLPSPVLVVMKSGNRSNCTMGMRVRKCRVLLKRTNRRIGLWRQLSRTLVKSPSLRTVRLFLNFLARRGPLVGLYRWIGESTLRANTLNSLGRHSQRVNDSPVPADTALLDRPVPIIIVNFLKSDGVRLCPW